MFLSTHAQVQVNFWPMQAPQSTTTRRVYATDSCFKSTLLVVWQKHGTQLKISVSNWFSKWLLDQGSSLSNVTIVKNFHLDIVQKDNKKSFIAMKWHLFCQAVQQKHFAPPWSSKMGDQKAARQLLQVRAAAHRLRIRKGALHCSLSRGKGSVDS